MYGLVSMRIFFVVPTHGQKRDEGVIPGPNKLFMGLGFVCCPHTPTLLPPPGNMHKQKQCGW